jgi:hypothetical protein
MLPLFHKRALDANGAIRVNFRDQVTGIPASYSNGQGKQGWAMQDSDSIPYVVYAANAVPSTAVRFQGIAFTTDGAMYVTADPVAPSSIGMGGVYVRVDGAVHVTLFDTGFSRVGGIAVSNNGRLVISDLPADLMVNLADAGAGAVNTAVLQGTGPATFTRATTAWTKLSTGLWASVASGTARSFYLGMDTAVGSYGGYLGEEARTNSTLQCRDLTNAAWTKSNATAAKTQIGIDGVTNSASSLTASAGNGTALQAITLASAPSVFSAFIKRLVGTGEIDVTQDNGSTWTNITSLINSTTFTQVQLPMATLANPTVGFRIVTSGDSIAIDMAQQESPVGNSVASTPIPTTVAAVTRNVDILTYPFSGNASTSAGSVYAEGSIIGASAVASPFVGFTTVSTNSLRQPTAATQISINDGANNVTKTGLSTTVGNVRKRAGSYGAAGMSVTGEGLAVATGSFDGFLGNTAIAIGSATNGTVPLNGTVKNVRVWQTQLTDAVLVSITA